ncbi:MAG: S9 family peptidase [Anaerolineae bacterium]
MLRYTLQQFAATRLYSDVVAYSPDGQQIAHITDTTGQFNLWTIPSGGGIPRQLTTFKDNTVRNVVWSPDGKQIWFQADHDGDEQHQMYLVGAAHGWPQALTNNPEAQFNIGDWSGEWMAYTANDVAPESMNVILRHTETGETRRLTTEGLFFAVDWSPNGRYLTLVQFDGNTNQNIHVYDHDTGGIFNATPHEGDVINFAAGWAADNSGFYMATNAGREFQGVAFYDLATRTWEWVFAPDHDVEIFSLSHDGRIAVFGVNEGGATRLYGRDTVTGEVLSLPQLPLGVVRTLDVSPDGTRIAIIFERPQEATNLYEFNLATGEMIALGQSMLGGIDPMDMVEPELVHYPTFDGRMIPAWLYKPKDTVEGMRYPVILSIHGGPEAQERPRYAYEGVYQYLLSRGFGILAPNIRGSTGYGITYQSLIHRDWGGAELKDIEHAAVYLRSLDWVDSNRLAVYGGSFGGFATLSAITRLPDYWAVGVDIVGPSNLVTFAKAVPPFWRPTMKRWVGDPEEDYDFLMERSPITYVDQIRAPLLVIQGAKDPRVVKNESDQLVERIRANGGDVEYFVDEEEGHGATRRANRFQWWTRITRFLEERLLDEPVVDGTSDA